MNVITDKERLAWCEEVLFRAPGKHSGWLTTDTGCGCCGEGVSVDSGVSFVDMVDAQILSEGRKEPAQSRAERIAELQAEIDTLLASEGDAP